MALRAHGPLDGMTFGNWFSLVRRYGLPKLGKKQNVKLALITCRNALQAMQDDRHAVEFNANTKTSAPLFILGYWRSGTTHLHNIIATDEQFAFPSQFDVNHPRTFLTSSLPKDPVAVRRVQDNILSSDYSPDEDEYALVATTTVTPYLSLLYPSQHRDFYRFLTFSDATPAELESFKSALSLFHQRLSGYYKKPMVYKSPGHIARVAVLLEMFPNAKFVHIHRDPSTVYQSKMHLLNSMFGDKLTAAEKHLLVVDSYSSCYNAFHEALPQIPEGNISHVAFSDLEANPMDSIRRIYKELQLPGFSSAEPAMKRYLSSQSDYKKNTHAPLSTDTYQELRRRWRTQAGKLGYQL